MRTILLVCLLSGLLFSGCKSTSTDTQQQKDTKEQNNALIKAPSTASKNSYTVHFTGYKGAKLTKIRGTFSVGTSFVSFECDGNKTIKGEGVVCNDTSITVEGLPDAKTLKIHAWASVGDRTYGYLWERSLDPMSTSVPMGKNPLDLQRNHIHATMVEYLGENHSSCYNERARLDGFHMRVFDDRGDPVKSFQAKLTAAGSTLALSTTNPQNAHPTLTNYAHFPMSKAFKENPVDVEITAVLQDGSTKTFKTTRNSPLERPGDVTCNRFEGYDRTIVVVMK